MFGTSGFSTITKVIIAEKHLQRKMYQATLISFLAPNFVERNSESEKY